MYEQHFGLEKRPFSVKATGTEVFVGPQTAKTMAGFRKALAVQDAVVTVSGAAGTGKTTLVERALDAIGSKYKTIRVGRVQMNASDVLESLLIVLGVTDRPAGTIQRFTVLRKKLKELQDAETRVFIVVEDALRAGTETLAELEALTAGDAGESDGASIILMGDERLFDYMKEPALAQLQQRVRQRHRIKPLCVAELRGYLKHNLRMVGGNFDQIFDAKSAELVHGLSEGIPRVANTIVDAVLVAAASQGATQVSAKMIAAVADDEFGLSVEGFDFSTPVEPDSPPAAVAAEDSQEPEPVEEATPAAVSEDATHAAEPVAEPAPAADVPPSPEPPALTDEAAPAVATEATTDAAAPAAEQPPVADVPPTLEPPAVSDAAAPAVVAEQTADSVADSAQEPAETTGEAPDPVIVFADDEQEAPDASVDIPHLIQDTLPDLAILSRRYETLAESYEEEAQAPTAESADAAIPELTPEPPAAPAEQEIPELMPEATTAAANEAVSELSTAPVEQEIPELTPEAPTVAMSEEVQEPVLPAADTPQATTAPALAVEPASGADPNWQLSEEPEFQLVTEVVPTLEEAATRGTDAIVDDVPQLQDDAGASDVPELQVEAEPVAQDAPVATPEPSAEPAAEAEALPGLDMEQPSTAEPLPEAAAAELPEWERDPTLAQLKPDLDALEQAMAFTHSDEPPATEKTPDIEPEKLAEQLADDEEIPEIILDKSIETGIEELDVEEPSDILPPAAAKKSDPELDRIAADIANAKSLEDIDDIMAETLFGSGISMIAEQIKANPPSADSANDELELAIEPPASPAPSAKPEPAPAAEQKAAHSLDDAAEEISIETRSPVANTGLDLSASQRLKTVRALNADLHPSLREPGNDAKAANGPAAGAPEPIEDQINTSITQTLKALKLPNEALDDEPEEAPKKGFLSRFRRS
ncbi:MAG: AAA family ATPase [Gammaproteobacteria bacterium]|nr:AAA family ATPase [Gammaproteobacteria bacterium]